MHKVGQYYGLETQLGLADTYEDGAPGKSASLQVKARLPRKDGQGGDSPLPHGGNQDGVDQNGDQDGDAPLLMVPVRAGRQYNCTVPHMVHHIG